ncbi:MAG TPA: hypothetical protein VEU97_06535 [Ktedonobacteraceae bacterium]|nr:hypothetical protein [Ktedonobacteraceae bacterium]
MLDNLFAFVDPIVDQDIFIAQLEKILEDEDPEQLKTESGNRYELYLLLQRLKSGGMSFEQFLAQAKGWAENQV